MLLHFDGWEMDYDYWTLPTSQNVKPVGWCSKNKKQLNPPKVYTVIFWLGLEFLK